MSVHDMDVQQLINEIHRLQTTLMQDNARMVIQNYLAGGRQNGAGPENEQGRCTSMGFDLYP